jgi:hypothetical protein
VRGKLHRAVRQAASFQRHVGVTHAAHPLRYPPCVSLDAVPVNVARENGAALTFVRMREPDYTMARVDGGAREHAAIVIEKFQLAIAHAINHAGFRAVRKVNVKRGVRGRVPVAIGAYGSIERCCRNRRDVQRFQSLLSIGKSQRRGLCPPPSRQDIFMCSITI